MVRLHYPAGCNQLGESGLRDILGMGRSGSVALSQPRDKRCPIGPIQLLQRVCRSLLARPDEGFRSAGVGIRQGSAWLTGVADDAEQWAPPASHGAECTEADEVSSGIWGTSRLAGDRSPRGGLTFPRYAAPPSLRIVSSTNGRKLHQKAISEPAHPIDVMIARERPIF